MIRRDVLLADGSAAWALISQIEHARISGQLAEHCVGRFSAPELVDVRREVLAAIRHHDDGWADWERAPRIDLKLRRPVSFMELEVCEAIDIWLLSIVAAEEQGPLAAWMVAGHFARLIEKSGHARQSSSAAAWRTGVQLARAEALASWQALNPAIHTREVAEEALQWLWTFDEVSLWFCCHCPAAGEQRPVAAESSKVGRETPIEMALSAPIAAPPAFAACASAELAEVGLALAAPWRFDVNSIDIEAAADLAPARQYKTSDELLAASRPHALRWRLTPVSSSAARLPLE